MTEPPQSPLHDDDLTRSILEFAQVELGPFSEKRLREPEALAAVRTRMAAGRSLDDAVLAAIHERLAGDPRLADEFAGHFLFDLLKLGTFTMSSNSKLRRFLDTGDLVVSVFGDMWGDFTNLPFESAAQFRAIFARRMEWKAIDEARRMEHESQREEVPVEEHPEALDVSNSDSDAEPMPLAIRAEERQELILILLRLDERERRMLTLHLRGDSVHAIAEQFGLEYDAARKALKRAVAEARRIATPGTRRRRPPN